MPVTGPIVPAYRRQPAERTQTQHDAGSYTLVADAHDRFCSVKPVGWVRSRVGNERHWTQTTGPLPSHGFAASGTQMAQAPAQAHPALLALREEQARADERAQLTRAASLESRTSSSVYGAHTLQRPNDASGVDPSHVNSVGAEQILMQQTRLWGSLQATSRRLGFGVSHAPADSALSEVEKEQDRRHYMSVATMSYGARAKDAPPPVIAVPDSMNRTSCNFPLSPVNQPTTARRNHPARAAATAQLQSDATAGTMSSSAGQLRSPSRQGPSASAFSASAALLDTSTAHALGYGRRHTFHRHYLSSAPQL